jgi:Sec7-like guanine-nucleotide exchange factor
LVIAFAVALPAASFAQETAAKTDKEKSDEAATNIAAMRDVLAAVSRKVEEARGERDALRLNCVNERKSQVSGLVKVAELALEELRAALKERQSEAVDHEYNKIVITRQKADALKTEADQCIGMLAFYDGDVERQFTDDNKDTATFDPTSAVATEAPVFRPPPASPLK